MDRDEAARATRHDQRSNTVVEKHYVPRPRSLDSGKREREREREKDAMFYEVPMRSIEGLSAADGDGGAQTMRLPAAWESIHRGACATGNI